VFTIPFAKPKLFSGRQRFRKSCETPAESVAVRILVSLGLALCVVRPGAAQVDEQHPYRRIALRTNVKVETSREKDARYRYSVWGSLASSDRRYTQKVRLCITVRNVSATPVEGIHVRYRIYKRDLSQDRYSVAASGETVIPHIESNQAKTLFTDESVCEYRLRWNELVRGNRLSASGERFAGYVVIYSDRKGPVTWDMSSETMYAEYARELASEKKTSVPAAGSISENRASLPYSADNMVYVTRTGRKFHRKSCRYLTGDARPLSREEALKSGYAPCSLCKP
jgi:hypothetical protein